MTDVPDRREARTETEHQFDVLVEAATDYAIFSLDAAGNVRTWNVGTQRIKGYTADEILGQHFSCFYADADRRAGKPEAALEAAAHLGRYELEGWRVRKDGQRFWVNAVIYAVRDAEGTLTGFIKVTRDITEKLRQQEARERARTAAVQAQKMEAIGYLTGGVAHDFNNLLAAILGSADLLGRRGDVPAPVKTHLAVIARAAERGASLTQRLLAFSRQQALEPRPLNLNQLVTGMSELLFRTLGESIQIETVLAGGLWRTCVDANQLESAILNLGINARDAMPSGGKLTLETGNTYLDDQYASVNVEVTPGQYVLIAVTDTGTGMNPEVLAQAFEPFYTTKSEGDGTGLGLSQVHGFVKQSGGHIKLYSEPGLGTSVKIYLPRFVGEVEVDEPPGPTMDVSILGRGEKVLVVDDDADVRQFVMSALISLGYQSFEAEDAPSALTILGQQPDIALLFTDVGLPGMNGRLLAEAALLQEPGIKVIYMTGYARNAIVHHGIVDQGVNLLPKPFTIEALGRRLRQVLDT
jgi:PAS domain S-box-containing protein